MLSARFPKLMSFAAGVLTAIFIFASPAVAQNNTNPLVDQFLANPSQVLAQYSDGGADLISLVRDVAVGHPEALQAIIGLLSNPNTNAAQQLALGSALGQAAQLVANTNQAYSNQIQQAVAGSGSQNAITAYSGVTGNVSIGSTGPGGGGGGGSGGPAGNSGGGFGGGAPGGGSNSGTGQTVGGGGTQTSQNNSFTGGGSGAGGGTNSGGSGSSGSVSQH